MQFSLRTLAVTGTFLASMAAPAYANLYEATYTFSQSSADLTAAYAGGITPIPPVIPPNTDGTQTLYSSKEYWEINQDLGNNSYANGSASSDWGSPGVGGTNTTYGAPGAPTETAAAVGFQISFAGVTISASSLAGDCSGGATGGTVFCTSGENGLQWNATISNNGQTITFYAPSFDPSNPSAYAYDSCTDCLAPGQNYFTNIFFSQTMSTVPTSFSGEWIYLTTTPPVSTPEPAALGILGVGLAGLGVIRRRRRA